jgi:hypothetical protein
MPLSLIACLAGGVLAAIVVIFALAGAIGPEFAATRIGQVVLAAVSAIAGLAVGRAAHARFFQGG